MVKRIWAQRLCFWGVALLCGLSCVADGGNVWASGIYFPANGARSAGKAGAVVATGDTGDMVIHNAANMSRLRGFGLRFDAQLSFQRATFTRQAEGTIIFDPVSKQDSPAFIPILSIWYNIPKVGPGSLTLSLYGHGPHGRSGYIYPETEGECAPAKEGDAEVCTKMPEAGPGRGTLIKTQSISLYVGLGAAYELRIRKDFRLRFGGSVRLQYVNAAQRQAMIAASNGAFYQPNSKKVTNGEVLVDVLADGFTFTGDLGLTIDLPMGFSVGASIFFANQATLNGTIGVQMNSTLVALGGVKAFGKELEVITRFPMIVRAGVGWKGYGLTVEAAIVTEFWNDARQQTLTPKGVEFEALGSRIPIPAFDIDQNFKDSISVRFGAEYNIKNWVWVRAGFIYESGALEENQVSVATIDYPDKIALTAGISGRIPGGLMIDVSVMHVLGRDITVTDSPLRPVDVSPDSLKRPGGVPSTSNGQYQFGMTGLFLGVRGSWGGSNPTNAIIDDAAQGAK